MVEGEIVMPHTRPATTHKLSHLGVPLFWPMTAALQMAEQGLELYGKNLEFLAEEAKIQHRLRPALATANRSMLDLRTMLFCDYSAPGGKSVPTLVVAPYAGHTAMIADYHRGQSLVETLLGNGVDRVFLTDWKSATLDMKDLEIDQYLAEINVCVDDLGGRVNFVGLCQGGWMSAMYAARFPRKIASLVLAGAPIDTDAGDGPVKRMAHDFPTAFYEELVAMGGGLMRGEVMLRGWKGMNPVEHYIAEDIELYEHIDDPVYLKKKETFESWYENPFDLPGRWYLQAIVQLFKENRLANGVIVGLGRRLDLKDVTCPVYLLAGEGDDITTREQVFDADKYLGTSPTAIEKRLVPGGHIGLFMGSRTLREAWPEIARWIAAKR
jgi:polyhydroxyalkanoate depolymerase